MPRGLESLLDQFGFGGEEHREIIVTASVITTVPLIILFFLGRRHVVQAITTRGEAEPRRSRRAVVAGLAGP